MTTSRTISPSLHNTICEFRNWYKVGKAIRGDVYDHPQFPDGHNCMSDYVAEFADKGDHYIVVGFSGRRYLAYKNRHHKQKKDVDL